jgi:transposase
MTQAKKLDFTGQNIFCGIDVHKKSWAVCIRNDRMELKTFSQSQPSVAGLLRYLRTNYPSADYKVVYEAGFCGFGYQRELGKEGVDCIVVNPADVPTTDKDKQRKSDAVDCRKLSRFLCDHMLEGIYIPSVEQQDDRSIVRAYHQMVKDQTRCKNRIKSLLDFQGISIPEEQEYKHWSGNFINWLKELPLTPSAKISLNIQIQHYEQTRSMVLVATRQLRALARQEHYKDQIKRLRSIPGIGEIGALVFAVEIGDINRFERFDMLCSYVGLTPSIHSSGDRESVKGLTHRGNQQLRETLIEASWVVVRKDPAMTLAFTEYAKRMKKNKAIIKIARKLLNRIRYVMKNQEDYETGIVE